MNEQMNVEPEQADIMWRALWAEIEKIKTGYSSKRNGAWKAYNAHLLTISLLRQINVRFNIVRDATFNEMVKETNLPLPQKHWKRT